MDQHPTAKLTPTGRETLVSRIESGLGVAEAARQISEGARHVYTRAYSPWQNGKVERMNRTLAQEWQYARAWDGEAGRASALPAFIEHYNWERPHSACGGLPPMSRIVGVNNLSAHNN